MTVATGWPTPQVRRLAGGLTVGLVQRRQAPVVSSVLCYRAGAAAEPAELSGLAHFLEHMMFKGSAAYAPGQVDEITQRLGGANNAYTSHDATLYQFSFAADHWHEALAMEADRMAGLRLEPAQVDAERRVILEELAMVEDDPWDALELAVMALHYDGHPYGRPVLGRRENLGRIGGRELARFHRAHYRPDRAVLAVAGDVGEEAFAAIEERFAAVATACAGAAETPPAPAPNAGPASAGGSRVELRRGELSRLLVALPAPPAVEPGYAALRLLLTILAGGRSSRLHQLLVEELRLCLNVGAEIDETAGPGVALLACELLPGASPGEVERRLLGELERLAADAADEEEIGRARRQLVADWVFARETAAQEAIATALALALFGAEHEQRHLQQLESCDAAELAGAAVYLERRRLVFGWSLPEGNG